MSKRKSEDSSYKAKFTKRTNSQEQPEQELFEQDDEALRSVSGLFGSQDNDSSLTEATRISRGSSSSQGEEAMEVVSESDIEQSTSGMSIGVTRSDRGSSSSQGEEAMEVVSESDIEQSTSGMSIEVTRSDRECCEHHLICKTTPASLSKENKRTTRGDAGPEKFSTKKDILIMCNALLNSGGGLLEIKFPELQNNSGIKEYSVDSCWLKIEPSLREMIYPANYKEVFDRLVQPNQIQLFVNAPKHFCTKKYNLYVPSDGSVLPALFHDVEEILKQKPRDSKSRTDSNVQFALKDLPKIPEEFCFDEKFDLTESTQVQYKHFTSDCDFLANRTHREKICKQLSAFGNCDGGVILLGVKDDQRVCGVDLAKTSEVDVVKKVRSQVKKVCRNFEPVRGVHWDVTFSTVTERESNSVIVIKMAGIKGSGGIFGKLPESYELGRAEDGRHVARLLEFYDWKKRMESDTAWWQENSKGMKEVTSKFQKMHISAGRLVSIKDSVQRIRDSFFKVDEHFSISPEGAVDNLPEEAKKVIHQIQTVCGGGRNRGLLVVSRSWFRDTGGKAIGGVICDVLVVSRNLGGLHLYTLCDAVDETSQDYSKEAAKAIKRSLDNHGARGQKFYVSFHVVSCGGRGEVEVPLRNDRFPKSYDLVAPRQKLNEILKAMVKGLTAVPSTLSSKVGVTILNLLTEEQFQVVSQMMDKTRELWVKGVAGTGKTLVAIEVMKRIKLLENVEGHEILYVCETEGLANQVGRSCSCHVVCRQTFLRREFPDARHVIMDEVHNYKQPRRAESWYGKAKRIVQQHEDRPGYLWFFIDPSGIPDEDQLEPQVRLRKVIRNSEKIFRFAKKWLADDASKVKVMHDFKGEDIWYLSYSLAKTSQIEFLKENLQKLLEEGYSHGDIAVLFSWGDLIPPYTELSIALNDSPWTSADQNHSDKIVISSVLKYSGLDRPVVVLVNVCLPLYKRHFKRFVYGAITRAMVKLVIINEESIHSESHRTNHLTK